MWICKLYTSQFSFVPHHPSLLEKLESISRCPAVQLQCASCLVSVCTYNYIQKYNIAYIYIYTYMHIMFWFVMLYYIILQRAMLVYYIIIQLVSFTFFYIIPYCISILFIYIYIYTAYILNLCVKSCQPSQDRSWRTLSCQRGRRWRHLRGLSRLSSGNGDGRGTQGAKVGQSQGHMLCFYIYIYDIYMIWYR